MQMRRLQSRAASAAELEAVHSPAHVAIMKRRAAEDAPCVIADFECLPDNTTYMAPSSFDDALLVRMPPNLPVVPRALQLDVISSGQNIVCCTDVNS